MSQILVSCGLNKSQRLIRLPTMCSAGRTHAQLHLDVDAFYAQVEEIRNPSLRDRPVAITQKYATLHFAGLPCTHSIDSRTLAGFKSVSICMTPFYRADCMPCPEEQHCYPRKENRISTFTRVLRLFPLYNVCNEHCRYRMQALQLNQP